MVKKVVFVILFLAVSAALRLTFERSGTFSLEPIKPPPVTVSVSIGEYRFSLYGYTSPKALVTIEGMGIYDQTYANAEGYFEFVNRFSPFSSHEACLTSRDQLGRQTAPVCIPPFQVRYNVRIGPVIMPPTLSLNQNYYYIGDTVVLSGQAVPNTIINLSTFIDEKKSFLGYFARVIESPGNLIARPVEAVTFPKVNAKTDSKGNYSIELPGSSAELFRLFAQTDFKNDESPKSNTLSLEIYPLWMIIFRYLALLFDILKGRLLELIVVTELVLLVIYFLRSLFKPHIIAREKALALRPSFLPEILPEEHLALLQAESLMIVEEHPLSTIDDK